MDDVKVFHPPRRTGLAFHAGAIAVLVVAGSWGFLQAVRVQTGLLFLLYLFPSLVAIGLVPVFAYRAYALRGAVYAVERDGLRLHWGLRDVTIPMEAVTWVNSAINLDFRLALPWLRWPGSLLGIRRLPDGALVEFLAADAGRLLLVATGERVFVISPERPGEFLDAYQRFSELGSLAPLAPHSLYPSFLLTRVWEVRPARYLLLAGAGFALLLLVLVSLLIPTRAFIHLGFRASQSSQDLVPALQLILLPIINLFFFLADLLLGLLFFRRGEIAKIVDQVETATSFTLAFLLWGSAVLTGLLFLAALYFIWRLG